MKKTISILMLISIILLGCSKKNEYQEYLSESAGIYNIVVFEKENVEETRKNINENINKHLGNVRTKIYDVNDADGLERAKKLDLKDFPVYFIFDEKEIFAKAYSYDEFTLELSKTISN